MSKLPNIFLIGPMGVGKSTIGRRLADELKRDFYDSDHEIEVRCGVDINWIFDLEGEEGFRQREQQIIADLVNLNDIVLATGGGAAATPANRDILSAKGVVIYLYASIEQQLARLSNDTKRPVLQRATDLPTAVRQLHEVRDPQYRSIADWTFNTDGRSIKLVVDEIIDTVVYKHTPMQN
ncbi:MAG: aroK [Gammaproteobacteria bacterium]|jgi:shikimate kinase|nr:aroK [Gammaproteobacteria bacterium]